MTGSPDILRKFHESNKAAKPNYHHMSIKKSQAILKCFVVLKSSVWFTLGLKTKPCFATLRAFREENFALQTSWKVKKNFRDSVAIFLILKNLFPVLFEDFVVLYSCMLEVSRQNTNPHPDGTFFVDLIGLGIPRDNTLQRCYSY